MGAKTPATFSGNIGGCGPSGRKDESVRIKQGVASAPRSGRGQRRWHPAAGLHRPCAKCRAVGCGGQPLHRLCLRHRRAQHRSQPPQSGGGGARAAGKIQPHLLSGHPLPGLYRACREAQCPGARPDPEAHPVLSTGAEAVENAIKIARAHTGRSGTIAFKGAFTVAP